MVRWGVLAELNGQVGCGLSNGGVGGRVNSSTPRNYLLVKVTTMELVEGIRVFAQGLLAV